MRNYLKYQSPGVQFAIFMSIAAGMFFVYIAISKAFYGDVIEALTAAEPAISAKVLAQFRWSQLISSILTFFIPALVYASLCDERPLLYLGLQKKVNVVIVFTVIILLISAQPFALYLGQLNERMNFGQLQQQLLQQEKVFEKAMNNFVRMDSPNDLVINLFIVGILPAVGEELFFRGALQSILEKWTKVPWVAILLSSFGFAFLHGTVFKFLGIFTLGIVLGTLFYITRNLWYNIFFHFLNNSLALLVSYYAARNTMMNRLAQDDIKISLLSAAASIVITVALFYFIRRKTPYEPLPASAEHFDIE
jgi:membrane protease YdiL (CAAX protease family)